MRCFKSFLPDIHRRKLIRLMKRVRHAAGDTRDVDGFFDFISKAEFDLSRKTRCRLLKLLQRLRRRVPKPLKMIFRKWPPGESGKRSK